MAREKKSEIVNCLRDEKVTVRFIKKQRGSITDPRSPLYAGKADNAEDVFCVPMLSNGHFKNVLTDAEKDCIEEMLGLEPNAMSVYNTRNNYWSTATSGCINKVILTKRDLVLDLNNVSDYIKYKILLANNDTICPSIKDYEDRPKMTYRYMLISETQEAKAEGEKANLKYDCYMLYGRYKDNYDVLRCIVDLMENKRMAENTKPELIQKAVTRLIDEDPKRFKTIVGDDLIEYKSLIKKGVEKGVIALRAHEYYRREDNLPLCEDNERPLLNKAAAFLADPKNQDIRNDIMKKIKTK